MQSYAVGLLLQTTDFDSYTYTTLSIEMIKFLDQFGSIDYSLCTLLVNCTVM